MSDRTSARLFGTIFSLLVKDVEKNRELAKEVYSLVREYDFNEYQMYCDEELLKLGLAEIVDVIDEPGEKVIKYK